MPKSRREKIISLTKTKKHGKETKANRIQEIRDCAERYAYLYVFNIDNMRSYYMKDIRIRFRDARFFLTKNKIMTIALGKSESDEVRQNIHKVCQKLKGFCGVMFANEPPQEALKYLTQFRTKDFARSGFVATQEVKIEAGPIDWLPGSLEPQLVKLGLPVELKNAVINVLYDHTICKEGDVLSPSQSRLLKHFGIRMSEFKITPLCYWSADGNFVEIDEDNTIEKIIAESAKSAPITVTAPTTTTAKSAATADSDDEDDDMEDDDDDDEEEEDESEEEEEEPTPPPKKKAASKVAAAKPYAKQAKAAPRRK